MDVLLYIIGALCACIGIVGSVVPILPGVALTYVGLVCCYFTDNSSITTNQLIIWGAITLIVSVLDYLLPGYFTKRFGGTKAGVMGANIGVFAGLFIFPPYGMILGPFVGALIGELTQNRDDFAKALKVATGSFIAFLSGTGLKLIVAVWMTFIIFVEIIPKIWHWIVSLF